MSLYRQAGRASGRPLLIAPAAALLLRLVAGLAGRSGRFVAPTEYAAAKADVQRASDTIAKSAPDLRALDPARAAALDRAMAVLRNAVSRRADPATVRRLTDAASAALRA